MFGKYKKEVVIRPAFETLLAKVSTVPLSIKLFESLSQVIPVFITGRNGSGAEEQKSRDADENLLRTISEKLKTVWTESKKGSWKNVYSMLGIVPLVNQYFPTHDYNEHFLDESFVVLRTGNLQTKNMAAEALCKFLAENQYSGKRNSIIGRVMALAQSPSYYERISYLDFCEAATKSFSTGFLKDKGIISAFVKLAGDKVSNLRIRWLGAAKNLITVGGVNEEQQKELVGKINELKTDKNKDVKKISYKIWGEVTKFIEKVTEQEKEKFEEEDIQKSTHEKELLALVLFF